MPAVEPRVVADGRGVRIVLPGDPGYDEAGHAGAPSDPASFSDVVRAISTRRELRRGGGGLRAVACPELPPPDGAVHDDPGVGPAPVPGRPVRLAPGVQRLTASNPGMMTGPGTNTYVVGRTELAVIDPGPNDPRHLHALVGAATAQGGIVRWVLVTHTHLDHAPGANPLARLTGAEVIGFNGVRRSAHDTGDTFAPDRLVGDGWALQGAGFSLLAVHTPGHAADHLCWLLDEPRWLFSGDHVMQGSTVVIRPPEGDMTAYLASLAHVRALLPPVAAIAPGHGRVIGDPVGAIDRIVAHRLERERRVVAALRAVGEASVDDLLPVVYADVDDDRRPVARFSLWAHLRKLAAEELVEPVGVTPGDDELTARWQPRAAGVAVGTVPASAP